MALSTISRSALRSRRAKSEDMRGGPAGFPHNPQDFSMVGGATYATRQTQLNRHWHYLPARRLAHIEGLSTTYCDVPIEPNGAQFLLTL